MRSRNEHSLRIGELAEAVGVTAKTIRFYEDIELLPQPPRSDAGYRRYGPDDVSRLEFVQDLQQLGFKLDEITEIVALRDAGRQPCAHVLDIAADRLEGLEDRLDRMRSAADELERILGATRPTSPTPSCGHRR